MGEVMIACPRTGEAVATGVRVALAFNVLDGCPSCLGLHVWQRPEALRGTH
jgi:hypothetical protein